MALADLNRSPRCQHVHYSGRPCKAPARRGRNYCVFHQAAHFDSGGCVLPIIEDLHSYQLAIIRIARALADDAIDSRKATALLYALQLAGSKLTDFVKLREEVENPARALYHDVSERYQARKHPFPTFISDKDLSAILKDIALEHQAEQNAQPPETIEAIPQWQPSDMQHGTETETASETQGPSAPARRDAATQSPNQQVSNSPNGVIPPQSDVGNGTHAEGAA